MITLIEKFFIKSKDYQDPKIRRAYGMMCSLVGIGLNILLFTGKYLAGVISGSVAITADAFNNLSDAGSSFVTLIGFRFAGMKPDKEHPFGHGRIEYISGFVVSMAILMMGLELAKTSYEKIKSPTPVEAGLLPVVILFVSICVKLYMCIYNRRIGKKIDSTAMKATSLDSLSDVFATTVVLLSMIVMSFCSVNIDGICGILVACFIFYTGFQAAKETLNPLLGQSPTPEFIASIERITLSYPEIVGIHDLVVHDYGPGRRMISLHGEVPGNGDIYELHDVIDRIERELHDQLGCEAVIHMDPIAVDDEKVMEMKEQVTALLKEIHETLTLHDFRMVQGSSHTNLIFDIVVPQGLPLTDAEVKAEVERKIEERWKNHYAVLKIDHSYVEI